MNINIIQAILIGVVYYLGVTGVPWLTALGSTIINRPLISGFLVGIILGDPVQGCIIGAAINLPYLAVISAGGSVAMDPGLAGTVGTALALLADTTAEVAVSLAVPIGLLGTFIWIIHMTVDITFVHLADKAAKQGDLKRIIFLNTVPPQIILFFLSVVPVTLAVYFGSGAVSNLLSSIEDTPIIHVLTVIGTILPALGIAMNLKSIVSGGNRVYLFYLLGFILSVYLKLPVIAISVLGFIIAYFYSELSEKKGVA